MASNTQSASPSLALVAALPSEGERLLDSLQLTRRLSCGSLEVLCGAHAGMQVLLAFSGLGTTNAAAAVATILARFTVSRLWMWGCAGAYPEAGAELASLALASEEILGDHGVATLSSWRPLNAIGIPLARTSSGPIFNRIPVDQAELQRARFLLNRWKPASGESGIHMGPFVTVAAASGSTARARALHNRFGALCENMEGAAAAQVCLRHAIPFLEIRALSNWAGDRRRRRWRLAEALKRCQQALVYLLEHWHEA